VPDLPAFRAALDADPDNTLTRLVLADNLEDGGDSRARVMRAACEIKRQLTDVALPDRFPTFYAESAGWDAVGAELETLTASPEDTPAFRQRYERLVRGDVPLDPELLEATLRLHYDLQVNLLASLGMLDVGGITTPDGDRYPLPAFDDVLARVDTPRAPHEACRRASTRSCSSPSPYRSTESLTPGATGSDDMPIPSYGAGTSTRPTRS